MNWRRIFTSVYFALIGCLIPQPSSGAERQPDLDWKEIARMARNAPSLYLTPEQKEEVARTFVSLVSLRSPSGHEGAIREVLHKRLAKLGAREMTPDPKVTSAPLNLVMTLAATKEQHEKPGLLLNAHLDTIDAATPEQLRFDIGSGDFFHADEGPAGTRSSFGADDKAGIAVVVGCLSALAEHYWSNNAPHRRIIVALTASEETGGVGARYLSEHQPEAFENVEISLTFDGPIEYHSDYPAVSFVVVVSDRDAQQPPYRHVIDLVAEVAGKKNARFGRTEIGLGMGDFAHFPPSAHSGLHIRSPQRGFHTQERTKLVDLVNHVDLLCHILLEWDRVTIDASRR
jgi:putative aminopeptidase FrvX